MLEPVLLLGQLASWVAIAHLLRRQRRTQAEMRAAAAEQSLWRENAEELASMTADLEATLKRLGEDLDARATELGELLEQAEAGVERLRQTVEAWDLPAAGSTPTTPARGRESGLNLTASQYAEVARLAASGMDPVEIAQRSGLGREEVRLILGLNLNMKGGSA